MFVIRSLLIGLLVILPEMLAAQSVTLRPLKPTTTKPVLYELRVQLSTPLSPTAVVEVQFPRYFDLSSLKIAGSNQIKGGIQFSVDSTTVTLKRSGLGPAIAAGQPVSLIFGPVAQKDTVAADSVNIRIFYDGLQQRTQFQAFKIGIR